MALRFRRQLGTEGAIVNVSGRGTRTTIGLPGSGISWSTARRPWGAPHRQGAGGSAIIVAVIIFALMLGTVIIGL